MFMNITCLQSLMEVLCGIQIYYCFFKWIETTPIIFQSLTVSEHTCRSI